MNKALRNIGKSLKKHSPAIMIGLGIGGMITGAVTAVKATPKALRLIEADEREKGEELTKVETVRAAWKCYIIPASIEVVSALCIISGSRVQHRRHAALTAAYTLSETALRELVEKTREVVSEEQFEDIQEKIAEDRIKKAPVRTKEVVTKANNVLCYDIASGRYFESNMDTLKRAESEINRRLLLENIITLNEFYDEIGLDHTSVGNSLGWDVSCGDITIDFTSKITDDGIPCIVIQYWNAPRYIE